MRQPQDRNAGHRAGAAVCVLLAALALPPGADPAVAAESFLDDFAAGLDPIYWNPTTNQPLYLIEDDQGDVRLSKPSGGTLSFQAAEVHFRYNVRGDFDVRVDFRDAMIDRLNGSPGNQVQLNATFGGQFFGVVRSDEAGVGDNVHVYVSPPGVWHGSSPTTATQGTLRIVRAGSTVSGFVDGALLYSAVFNGSNAHIWFSLQNNGTTDATSVTFDDFQLTADEILGPPAGTVLPDPTAPPLEVERLPAGMLGLSWGASCRSADHDYAVYEGVLGSFASHLPVSCTTGGATSLAISEPAGDAYFLVVPQNDRREGSYGLDGSGAERLASVSSCLPQLVGTCDCGDGVAFGFEVCDGGDLRGADCVSLGYGGGLLQCSPDCRAYDASNCTP